MIPVFRGFLVLLMFAAQAVSAQPLKIGYVNPGRIEAESALALKQVEQLRKEFAAREQQLQEVQKNGAEMQAELEKNALTMSATEKQAKEKRFAALAQQYQQMQRSFMEELDVRKREERERLLQVLSDVIKGIGDSGKFDLITQQAVYSSNQIDLTEQVLKELAKRSPPGADTQ